MPGRGKSSRRRGRARPSGTRLTNTSVIMYEKNITWKTWYDNNGEDEQGLRTDVPLNKVIPASSSTFENDLNRSATINSVRIQCRWTNGFNNPPVAMQLVWSWPVDGKQVFYNGRKTTLNNSQFTSMTCGAPRPLRNYIISNPSNETDLELRILFFGMDMKPTDLPALIFDVRLSQEPVRYNAHSGK